MVVLCGYTPKPWLYVLVRGYTNLSSPYASTSYQEKHRGGCVSHTVVIRLISWLFVVIRRYILHMYPKGAITIRRWFYMVIRSKPWLYTQSVVIRLVVLLMRQQLTRKTKEWLCVHDRGYTSHIVIMRGYTWLYAAYVPKRCHNLQTMVLCVYTIKAVVICPSSWLYDLLFSWCVTILPVKPSPRHRRPGAAASGACRLTLFHLPFLLSTPLVTSWVLPRPPSLRASAGELHTYIHT